MAVSVTKVEEALFRVEDCITLPEAEALLNSQGFYVTKAGMIRWLKKYPIGMKVAGRWYVQPDKMALLLNGKMGERVQHIK
jgi:hypothetical protein